MKHPVACAALVAALVAGPGVLLGEPSWKKAADNHNYAQSLVDDLRHSNPDLVIIGFHAIPPGQKTEMMIASTLDRIGEPDDPEDYDVVKERETILARSIPDPTRFKVHLPMLDASGRVIGLMALIFKYEDGRDDTYYCKRALAIRNQVAGKIGALDDLFREQ